MDQAWTTHRRQLDELVRSATRDMLTFARARPTMTADDVQMIYTALVETYGAAAAESAVLALEDSRAREGARDLPSPVAGSPAPAGQVAGSFAWANSQAENEDQLARIVIGPLGRLIRQSARDTVFTATREAGTRWARIPGPTACWFCLMLASRGAVYHSKQSASLVSQRSAANPESRYRNDAARAGHSYDRGRPAGAKFHDNCSCQIVEVKDSKELPGFVADLYDEWSEVTYEGGLPAPNQIGLWRKHITQTRPNGETVRPL